MIIIIDAYNLFKTVLHVTFITSEQRLKFMKMFEAYVVLKPQNKLILIFDGGPDGCQSEDFHKGVFIFYAGAMQSADDVIKKKLCHYKSDDILLITCDRELRKYARQLNIDSLGSLEFYKILENNLQKQNKIEQIMIQKICKTNFDSSMEIDILMELASRQLLMKDQDQLIGIEMKKNDSQSGKKKDKKLLKKIAKI